MVGLPVVAPPLAGTPQAASCCLNALQDGCWLGAAGEASVSGDCVLSGRKEGTDVQCCIDQLQAAGATVLSVSALCSMMLCIVFMHD